MVYLVVHRSLPTTHIFVVDYHTLVFFSYILKCSWTIFYHVLSLSRSLIGREPWEMRVHTTACFMNACREWLWSIYCRLGPRKKSFFSSKLVNFNESSTTIIVIRKKEKNEEFKTDDRRTRIVHMTERKKASKPCKVLFLQLNESMKLIRSDRSGAQGFGKTSSYYWL